VKVDLPAALPPRARSALIAFGVRSLAEAAGLSDAELLRIKGVGKAAVEVIRGEGGGPPAPTAGGVGHDALASGALAKELREEGRRLDFLIDLASHFVDLLAEKHSLAPHIVALAWDLALAFDQEAHRSAGVDLELHDGLRVRFAGKVCEVRLSPPPAGTEHRTVALVPVEG
jgi:hypothetical protein